MHDCRVEQQKIDGRREIRKSRKFSTRNILDYIHQANSSMLESNFEVPVNTPVVELNGSVPLNGVQQNHVTQITGTQTNLDAFFHEVCLRLEIVQAQPERQLGVWRYRMDQTES